MGCKQQYNPRIKNRLTPLIKITIRGTKIMDYESEIVKNHFDRLNNYRNTKEFVEWARSIGYDEEYLSQFDQENLPSMLGNPWEINEDIYYHFLEILPPMGFKNGTFYMCEYNFDNITAKFTENDGKFYCEFARYTHLMNEYAKRIAPKIEKD